jgi:hypothetical protein
MIMLKKIRWDAMTFTLSVPEKNLKFTQYWHIARPAANLIRLVWTILQRECMFYAVGLHIFCNATAKWSKNRTGPFAVSLPGTG